jgi:hypothetical protein
MYCDLTKSDLDEALVLWGTRDKSGVWVFGLISSRILWCIHYNVKNPSADYSIRQQQHQHSMITDAWSSTAIRRSTFL